MKLAEFQIQRYADGVIDASLPCTVWVDKEDTKPLGHASVCGCGGPFYTIRGLPDGVEITDTPEPGMIAAVCSCMGYFL